MDSLLTITNIIILNCIFMQTDFFSFVAELFRLNLLAENYFLPSAMYEYTTFATSHFYVLGSIYSIEKNHRS